MWVSLLMWFCLILLKAFDVVSHNLLLDKLRLLGICSPLTDWIADFLIGRVMSVSVSDTRIFMDVSSGGPQGTCFVRCCLFFLLIIYLIILFLNVSFYADDLKIYLNGNR